MDVTGQPATLGVKLKPHYIRGNRYAEKKNNMTTKTFGEKVPGVNLLLSFC